MRMRKEQFAALGAKKAAKQRQDLLAEFEAKGVEAKEESPGGPIQLRDAAGGQARMHAEDQAVVITTGEQRQMRMAHNSHGQLQSVTDPAGLQVEFDYDNKGRLHQIRRGSHSKFGLAYDELDHVNQVRYPDGTKLTFRNDGQGKILRTIDRNNNIARRSYDSEGRQTEWIDFQANVTEYRYGDFDMPEEIAFPHGVTHQFRFSEEGELSAMLVEGQAHAHFSSDEQGSHRTDYADGTFIRLLQNDKGLIEEAENEQGIVKFEYDDYGKLLKEDTNGRVVEYERDEIGNLKAIITPDGKRISYERDREHRVQRITDWNGKPYEAGYHTGGALESIRFPNGSSVNMNASEMGLPASLTITSPRHSTRPIIDCKFEYDLCDRLIKQTEPDANIRYGYDHEGRLLEAIDSSGERSEKYALDANGNRTRDAAGKSTFNEVNQLQQRGGDSFAYDPLGNMTSGSFEGKQLEFRYNGRGQLVEAMTVNGKVEYAYDAIGRRTLKRFAGKTTRYLWAGSQLLAEITGDGSNQRRRDYLFFEGKSLPVAMLDGEQTYYFHCGRRSEPLAMTNDDARLVWQADYSAFGQAEVSVREHRHQPFRLAGQYFDEETGLHYNVARYYSPLLGRFLTQDPLREDGGSWNFYNYCDGDPLNRLDPDGELIFTAILVGVAVGAVIGAAVMGGSEYIRQKSNNEEVDAGKIAKKALIGGLIGAVGGGVGAAAGAGVAAVAGVSAAAMAGAGFVEGVAASVAEQCVENQIEDKPNDWPAIAKEAAVDGLIGAGIGLVTAGVGGVLARRARKGVQRAGRSLPPLRSAYIKEVEELKDVARQMRSAGNSSEEIARELHQRRRALGVKYKDLTPQAMRDQIYQRNLEKYGDELGPSIEYLRNKGKSWDDIIESSSRSGGSDLGLAK